MTLPRPLGRLAALTALLTIVLTITLPLVGGLHTHLTHTAPTHHTTQASPTQTPSTTANPRPSKADKAAAHHDGCRQTSSSNNLISRPSCRSGMPVTRDHMALTPDTRLPGHSTNTAPIAPSEVPPAWSGHWRQAAHSPYHHSRA